MYDFQYLRNFLKIRIFKKQDISDTVYFRPCQTLWQLNLFDLILVTQCSSFPCQNGGTCSPNNNTSYNCSCQSGYFGSNCQINPCLSNPCQNGGTCTSLSNSTYSCSCPANFYGNTCQSNPCSSSPCLNSATCVSLSSTNYSCSCSSFAFGNNCQNCKLEFLLFFIFYNSFIFIQSKSLFIVSMSIRWYLSTKQL